MKFLLLLSLVFILIFQPSLQQCNTNCVACTATNECTRCKQGYTLDTSKKCIKIEIDFCVSVLNQECTRCSLGYFLSGETCDRCAVAGCQRCNDKEAACQACYPGFFYRENNCDTECSTSNCANCTLALNGCQSCMEGHRLRSEDNRCEPCSISNCESCNLSPRICTKCLKDYFLDGEICTLCPNGCALCQDARTCSRCDEDFKFYMNSKQECLGRTFIFEIFSQIFVITVVVLGVF